MADLFQTKPLYNAMLGVYAQREGLKQGLSGAKLADFVNNLSPETFAKVEQAARDTSENVALHSSSPLGRAIIQLREASPLMALNILFVQTPLNIAKLGLRYSPAGPLRLLTEGGRADPARRVARGDHRCRRDRWVPVPVEHRQHDRTDAEVHCREVAVGSRGSCPDEHSGK